MTEYQRLDTRLPQKTGQVSAEDRYWKSFKNPVVHKHFIKVTDLQFSPVAPHDLAACASTRVTIYDPLTLQPTRTLSRFKDVALSSSFRPDGRLLSASSHDGLLHTFDLQSRVVLRTYAGHVGPVWSVVHSKGFGALMSGGDDREVRVWDVSSEECVRVWKGHTDYVRVVREEAEGENLVVSGSYDGTVRYWDRRLPPDAACTLNLTHGAPVNAFVLIPAAAAAASISIITAGDVSIKAWDVRYHSASAPARPVQELSSHQKAITSLALSADSTRLLSASLDGFVKVTALPSLTPLSSIKCSAPLLACALSPDSTTLAVGTVDGTLTLRQRPPPPAPPATRPLPRMGSHAWFNRGAHSTPSPLSTVAPFTPRRQALQPYDVYLKRFHYHAALDAALRTNKAIVIASMLEELIDRGGLVLAVSGRDEEGVSGLLGWLLTYVSHPAYMGVVLDVMGVVLRVYGGVVGGSVVMDEWVRRVQDKVREEVRVMDHMMQMRGMMELIWRGSERLAQSGAEGEKEGEEEEEQKEGEEERRVQVSIEEVKEGEGGDDDEEEVEAAVLGSSPREVDAPKRRRKRRVERVEPADEVEEEEEKRHQEEEDEQKSAGEEVEAAAHPTQRNAKRKKERRAQVEAAAAAALDQAVAPAAAQKRKSRSRGAAP